MVDHCVKLMNELKEVKKIQISSEDETNTTGRKSKMTNELRLRCFGGKFNLLPKDWVISNLKFQTFLIMWLLGMINKANRVQRFASLRVKGT